MTNPIYDIEPWQQDFLNKIMPHGGMPPERFVISAARQTGKSYYFNKLRQYADTDSIFDIMYPKAPKLKYNFSRAKWHETHYNWEDHDEVQAWCTEQFGAHPNAPDAWSRWITYAQCRIKFRDAKDYAWFMLKWGAL